MRSWSSAEAVTISIWFATSLLTFASGTAGWIAARIVFGFAVRSV